MKRFAWMIPNFVEHLPSKAPAAEVDGGRSQGVRGAADGTLDDDDTDCPVNANTACQLPMAWKVRGSMMNVPDARPLGAPERE